MRATPHSRYKRHRAVSALNEPLSKQVPCNSCNNAGINTVDRQQREAKDEFCLAWRDCKGLLRGGDGDADF